MVRVVQAFTTFMIGLAICLVITLLSSCRTTKVIEYRDSIRTEIRYKTVKVPDTVYVDIPSQSETVIAKDSSLLENDYSLSFARINLDGTLLHTLRTKPQQKPVQIEKIIEYKDSIVYKDKIITEVKEVEKKLSWWQSFCINGFPILFGAFCLVIVFVIIRKRSGY